MKPDKAEQLTQKLLKKREIDDQIKFRLKIKESEENKVISPTQSEDPKFHTKFVKKTKFNWNGLGSEMALVNDLVPSPDKSKRGINTIDVIAFDEEFLSNVASKNDKNLLKLHKNH